MTHAFVEVDEVGYRIDLTDPAEILNVLLHHADLADGRNRVRVGGLVVTAELTNPGWADAGDLPSYRVTAIEVED